MERIKKYTPILLIFAITTFFLAKIIFPTSDQIIFSGDIKHIYYPYREFLRASIFKGQIPFWNPYLFSGTPFMAHPYTEFFYPTTLLLLFLPSNLYFSVAIWLHIFLAGIFMFQLLKKFTDIYSAMIGGIIFSVNGFFASRIYAGHLDYIISMALIPFVFLASYEYILNRNKKALLPGCIVLCLQIFTGLLIVTFYTFLIIFSFILIMSFSLGKITVKRITSLVIFFAAGIGLSAVYLIPSYEFISNTIRGEGLPYRLAAYGSSTWQTMMLFINPLLLGSDFNTKNPYHGPPPDYTGYIYFVGVIPLIIISFGLLYIFLRGFFRRNNNDSSLLPIMAMVFITFTAILISLGPNSPINLHYVLWNFLQIYKTTRLPVRHLTIVVFTLSFLSGLILKYLKSSVIKILLLIAVVVELTSFGSAFIFLSRLPKLIPGDDTFKSIITEKEIVRILPDFTLNSPVREEISFASPMTNQYFSTSGYTPAILTSYYDFIDRINGNTTRSTQLFNSEIIPSQPYLPGISFLNAKYIIVDNTADLLSNSNNYDRIKETEVYRIYRNKSYFPRFFFVPQAKIYKDMDELRTNLVLDQKSFDRTISIPSTEVLKIKYQPNCNTKKEAKINILKYELNKIILTIDTPCNGFISTSEVNYPGWQATIDGEKTDIITSNLSFRALNVPAGTHSIIFYYNPRIWVVSGIISIFFLLGLIYHHRRRV